MNCSVVVSLFYIILIMTLKLSNVLSHQAGVGNNPSEHSHTGIYSFDQLVTSDLFVDKSMMIKEFIESESKINVITRPRKWGKSVNIEILKRFFEIETNNIGIPLKKKLRNNYKIFVGGEIKLPDGSTNVLKSLKISNESTSMKRLGIVPVILFKMSVKGKNYRAVENNLKKEMKNTYLRHSSSLKELLIDESKMLNATDKSKLAKYLSNKQLDVKELENGLFFLSRVLQENYLRKVITLIDDYDFAMNHAVESFGEKEDETQKMLSLLQNIFKGVINNWYMDKCLITGTLPFSEDTLFPNVSEVSVHSLLDEGYSQSFGYSESEVDELLKKTLLSNATSVDKMKYWYEGYRHGSRILYNPLDIMGFISNQGTIRDYWVDSGRVKSLDEFMVTDEAQEDLKKLLEDEGTVKSLRRYESKVSSKEGFHLLVDIFYRLLVHHGYLNSFNQSETGHNYLLRIPNQEIRNYFVDYKAHWFCAKYNLMISEVYDFVGSLISSQVVDAKDSLKVIFKSLNNSSMKEIQEEKDYHKIMGEILYRLVNHNIIISNKHLEIGKFYHMIIPRSKFQGHTAFVLEYKCLNEINSTTTSRPLQALAQKTVDYIDSNVYGPLLANYKYVDKVITLAIVFHKTDLELAYKVFKQHW